MSDSQATPVPKRPVEKCRTQFKWHKPRTDNLIGTRYEVMGWLHVLFAHADPQVYIDITMEHQKKAHDFEAQLLETGAALDAANKLGDERMKKIAGLLDEIRDAKAQIAELTK